ncbi:hypothetical protein Tco_0561985 [Tanacetum coccineum]
MVDENKENDELRLHLTLAPDEEKEVDYEILDRKYPIKEWKTECLGTKPISIAQFLTQSLSNTFHNMVAYLEKSEGNAEFHEIIDFLKQSSIHHALTKGKHFSGKVTPLFATMLVQPTQDEGASSERPSEAQPTPSPAPTSEVPHEPQTDSSPAHTSEVPLEQQTDPSPRPSPTTTIPDSIPETSGGNLGGHSSSDKSLSGNEGEMTLQSVYDLCLSLCAHVTDQAKEIQHLKAQIKKLKKQAKPVIHHHRACRKGLLEAKIFKEILYLMRFLKIQLIIWKQRIVDEDKEIEENVLSTEDVLSTDKDKVSTDKEKVSTDRPIVSTDGYHKFSTDRQIESTDGQRKEDDESESESDGIPEAEKKFKQLESDEEMARKIQEEWEGEEERNRIAEEKAAMKPLQ